MKYYKYNIKLAQAKMKIKVEPGLVVVSAVSGASVVFLVSADSSVDVPGWFETPCQMVWCSSLVNIMPSETDVALKAISGWVGMDWAGNLMTGLC